MALLPREGGQAPNVGKEHRNVHLGTARVLLNRADAPSAETTIER